MSQTHSRIGRLLSLICLMILVSLLAIAFSGCESLTLIGSLNLGGDIPQIGTDTEEAEEQNGENEAEPGIDDPDACWPSASAAFAEMVAHGFTPKKWPETETWFRRLEAVKQQLPPCSGI